MRFIQAGLSPVRRTIVAVPVTAFLVLGATAGAQTSEAPPPGVAPPGVYGFGLPPDVSTHGHQIDQLINFLHWFMLALFVGWGVFMVYCLVRFRLRAGQDPSAPRAKGTIAKTIEGGVVIVEAVLLLGFSIPIWGSVKTDFPSPEDNPLRVRVIAEQFAWSFHYPGNDGVFGRTAPQFIGTVNPVGLDPGDPAGKDDIVSLTFNMPVGRPVICELTSKDVIHSFFIPVLRVKQDVIPGMRIPVWFEATKTGSYQVACAQLCGNNHYKMLAPLEIQTAEAFADWLTEKSAPPEEFIEDEL